MDVIRATKITVNGERIKPSYLKIKPPEVNFKSETDDSGFIDTSVIVGIEELKPEITVSGFPGGVAGFISLCHTDAPIIQCWSTYTSDAACETQQTFIELQVQILGATTPLMKPGKVDDQTLKLGSVIHYKQEVAGQTLYDIYPFEHIVRMNGKDMIGAMT